MTTVLRRGSALLAALLFCLAMAACSSAAARWQEQYDLGQQYLTDLDYEQAIAAFTAAIEIDPNRGEAYEGRGDAHVALAQVILAGTAGTPGTAAPEDEAGATPAPEGEAVTLPATEGSAQEHYTQARADYEKALDTMEMTWPLVGKLADVYDQLGDTDALVALLQNAQDTLGDGSELDELMTLYGLTRGEDGAVEMDFHELYRGIADELTGVDGRIGTYEYYLPCAQIQQTLAPYAEKLERLLDSYEEETESIGSLLQRVYAAMGDMDKLLATRQRLYALTGVETFNPNGYTDVYGDNERITEYNEYGQRVRYTNNDCPYYDIDPVTYAQGPKKYYSEIHTYTYNEYGQLVTHQLVDTAPPSIHDNYVETYTYDAEGRLLGTKKEYEKPDRPTVFDDYTYEGDTVSCTHYVTYNGVREGDTHEYVYQIDPLGMDTTEIARYTNGVLTD